MNDDLQWARPAPEPEASRQPGDARISEPAGGSSSPPEPGLPPTRRETARCAPGAVVLRATGLERTFRRGSEDVVALAGVDLELARGEVVALVGPSGSGKTTLLNVLCGWEVPDKGTVSWNGTSLSPADVGWEGLALVPQTPGLVEDLSVTENVGLPCRLRDDPREVIGPAVEDALLALGLSDLSARFPDEISLGEQQRVSIARALVLRPDVLLADEPTAHQDERSMGLVLGAIRAVVDSGKTCMVASHNPRVIDAADRVLEMRDGRLGTRR